MELGLEEVETYFLCHQNNISQYIVICRILELYLVAERRPGVRVNWRWWEQVGINFRQDIMRAAEWTGELEEEV